MGYLEKLNKEPVKTEPDEAKPVKGFTFVSEKRHACAGIANTVAEYRHDKTGMEFVLVPGGEFDMGSESGSNDEKPVHRVKLSPFLIGKHQVTQAVWQKVMGKNPANFKGADRPVETVSWDECKDFCGKAGLQLPTEAQWEYACRAGSKGEYCFRDDEAVLGDYAWYDKNSGNETHPVGQKEANAFGLYDVHGNVWEWCEDWYGGYTPGAHTDPTGPSTGSYRVHRGGSYYDEAELCRAVYRCYAGPGLRDVNLGMRCARSL